MKTEGLTGEAIRFQLENYGVEDYEDLILGHISEVTDMDYDDMKGRIKVKLYPSDNQRLIEFNGDEDTLYNLMVELSQYGNEPIARYPALRYTYDILGKKIEVIPSMDEDNMGGKLF